MIQTSGFPQGVSVGQKSERMLKFKDSRIDLTHRILEIASDLRFGIWDLFGIWNLKIGIYRT